MDEVTDADDEFLTVEVTASDCPSAFEDWSQDPFSAPPVLPKIRYRHDDTKASIVTQREEKFFVAC